MSIRITTDVFCNQCGNWAHYTTDDKPKHRAALAAAMHDKWLVKSTTNLTCPMCSGVDIHYWESSFTRERLGLPARKLQITN